MPEMAFDFDLHDLEIGDRGQKLRVPIDEPLVLIDQLFFVELHEDLHDCAGESLVHRKALARPVAGGAESFQLIDDGAAELFFPAPDFFEKFFAAHFAPAGPLMLHQLPLDHHLRGDAGMIGAGLPEHILAAHALEAAENVLQRVVQRMAHMQRARHIRRRNHHRKGLGVAPFGASGAKGA